MLLDELLGIVFAVIGIIILLIVYNAIGGLQNCSAITDTTLSSSCTKTKSYGALVFSIVPVFILLGILPMLRNVFARGFGA